MSKRAIHPGDILTVELEELGLQARDAALLLHIEPERFASILGGRQAMDADTALRLSRWLGTSAAVWLHLQMIYDLRTTEQSAGAAIRREVEPHQHNLSEHDESWPDKTVHFSQRNF